MNYLALPLGILLWYLIEKRVGEKVDYSILSRILCGIVCLIILFSVNQVHEYREEHYNFWLGILPSFLAALGFPFAFIVLGTKIKNIFKNQFLSWALISFVFLTIYEIVLWLDGRNFDMFDVLFTLIGSFISGLIISNLIPKMLTTETAS